MNYYRGGVDPVRLMIKLAKQTVFHLEKRFVKGRFYFLNVIFSKLKLMTPIIYNLMYTRNVLVFRLGHCIYIIRQAEKSAKVNFETKKINLFILVH